MRKQNNHILYSPSDVVAFLHSPFITWMNRLALEQPELCPEEDPQDALLDYLADKGLAHESAFLDELRLHYESVVEINTKQSDEARLADTLHAMESGAELIFQACLMRDNFRGYADFLVRVPGQLRFGDYLYEPWDTKLSRSIKPYFVVQLACYAELLEELQGVLPNSMAVVLGDQTKHKFRVSDYLDYYRAKKDELLEQQAAFDADQQPDPFDFADHGNWSNYVEALRHTQDHLSLVANISRLQIKKLEAAGIGSLEALSLTALSSIPKLNPRIFDKLKQQARIQLQSREKGSTCFEVIAVDAESPTGLALLPLHHDADLFWDLEGFPLVEGGLEYLWGCAYFDERRERLFWERWAHDHEQEEAAFRDFIKFAYQRWLANPGMHIYHYGHYEVTVCQRLMGRYGAGENEIDELLRNGVFVDLYKIVRQGLLIGEPKYSIKNVEHLYRGGRDTEVSSGGDSVAVYARWRDNPDGDDWETSSTLSDIRDYNIDDCNSTQELVDWLRDQQRTHGITYASQGAEFEAPALYEFTEEDLLENALRDLASDNSRSADDRVIAGQLAWLVKFHKRANKPMWWRYFERLGMDFAELYDDPDCLAGCQRTNRAPFIQKPRDRNLCYEYSYDTAQEFRNRRFTSAKVLSTIPKSVAVCDLDTRHGTLLLKSKFSPPANCDLIADEYVSAKPLEDAIKAIADAFLNHSKLPKPLREFLLRLQPDVSSEELLAIDELDGQAKLEKIVSTIAALNNSYISIQGPPGTGKTYTAKHIILELLRRGHSIGITSNSHEAINNLLLGVLSLMEEQSDRFTLCKIRRDPEPQFEGTNVICLEASSDIDEAVGPGRVVGATAWGFARQGARVDYLFIDEAGQVSIANFVAMSAQAKNIVCLGDQMQLPQPVEGTHPGDSGLSILDYILKDHATIPPEMGVFLNRTYRMHAGVNAFISEAIYESRLNNDPACDRQEILFEAGKGGLLQRRTGIQYISLDHSGNKQASFEEVSMITELVPQLLSSQWRDKQGQIHPLKVEDILIVAPFNYQVNELKKALGPSARIGTVDKFQGQEAPVVIVSMAASVAAESSKGVRFLLKRNRLNVAVSRAQALVMVVASSSLLEGCPTNLADINLYSLFYRLRTAQWYEVICK
ncbi:TM0106 family RecB-like putative nuclease [Allohahella marinimesophila]|uniref:TM0106 family RecB-like putative nuclease n=1 Tax=Allohahella marinimesophila TaxID=1054972 RepID=UPI0031D72B95